MNRKWMQWAAVSRMAGLQMVFVSAVWLGCAVLCAQATIQTNYTNSGISDYAPEFVSANDLVESDQPTVTNVTFSGTALYGSSYAKMNDGYKLRGDLSVGNTGESLTPSDGSVLTFYLDGPHNITRIETFTVHPDRCGQKYTLAVTTQSNPSYTNVAAIDFPKVTGALQLKVTIVNDAITPIPDGVTSLRFTFSKIGGMESVYREIDINPGAPPVISFVTNAYSGTPTETVPDTVASNDLVNTGQPSLTNVTFSGTALYGSSYTRINDGGKLGGESYTWTGHSLTPADGSVLTFELNKAYTITNIQALSSHNSRNNHCYTLSAREDGASVFTTVARLAFLTTVNGQYRVMIRNDGDPRLAKAAALRFTFRMVSQDTVYREIDVFGVPRARGTVLLIR